MERQGLQRIGLEGDWNGPPAGRRTEHTISAGRTARPTLMELKPAPRTVYQWTG